MGSKSGDVFQEYEGILSFQVSIGGKKVEVFLSQATCDAMHRQVLGSAASLADFYRQYQPMLDEIVLYKVNAGARQPVVLMARDLQRQPAGHRTRPDAAD